MGVPLNAEIASLLRDHRRAGGGPDALVFDRTPNRQTWHRVLNLARVRSEDDRRRTLTQHGCRKWLASELDRLGASPGILATALRHFEGIAQKHYVDRLLGECREYFSRLPKLWPDRDLGAFPDQGPKKNPTPDACNGPAAPIDSAQPSGDQAKDEHALVGSKCPLSVDKSVLKGAVEAHLRFLRIVESALLAGDDAGNPTNPRTS